MTFFRSGLFCGVLIFTFFAISSSFCAAQESVQKQGLPMASGSSEAPIEITASKDVEWNQPQKQYIAREDVVVKQGEVILKSDLLTADYEDTGGKMAIVRLTAEGEVSILSAGNVAQARKAIYDIRSSVATLTGDNLKITAPDQVITAQDLIEYNTQTREARAVGNALVVRGKDTLKADQIHVVFSSVEGEGGAPSSDRFGGGRIEKLLAKGHVIISTPEEVISGDDGVFVMKTNTAELTGNVRIERGPNHLEGHKAVVNMSTHVSQLLGGGQEKGKDGRVRGLFFPASQKKSSQ